MLRYLDPYGEGPAPIAILTREGCSFCAQAKKMLSEAGYDYAEIPLPHTIRSKALGAIAERADGAAGVRRRAVDRRLRKSSLDSCRSRGTATPRTRDQAERSARAVTNGARHRELVVTR